MGIKEVKAERVSRFNIVQKGYEMHTKTTRKSFCGVGYGKSTTKVDKEAVGATLILTGFLGVAIPEGMKIIWYSIMPSPKPKKSNP